MRTSKKMLSLFLALVMIITSCSVGFTAFAADGNKTDSNLEYWNEALTADDAFKALNTLAGSLLEIDALKELLDENGLSVDSDSKQPLSDLVANVSPLLTNSMMDSSSITGFLSGNADVGSLGTTYSKKFETNSDTYYAAYASKQLPNTKDGKSFYTLYAFAEKYKDNANVSEGVRDYATYLYKELSKFLKLNADEPAATTNDNLEKALTAQEYMDNTLYNELTSGFQPVVLNRLTYDDIANTLVGRVSGNPLTNSGKSLAEVPATAAAFEEEFGKSTKGGKYGYDYYIKYYNNILTKIGMPKLQNAAELIYYHCTNRGKYVLYTNIYLYLLEQAGKSPKATAIKDGATKKLTVENAYDYVYKDPTDAQDNGIFTLNDFVDEYVTDRNLFNNGGDDTLNEGIYKQYVNYVIFDKVFATQADFEAKGDSAVNGYGDILLGLNKLIKAVDESKEENKETLNDASALGGKILDYIGDASSAYEDASGGVKVARYFMDVVCNAHTFKNESDKTFASSDYSVNKYINTKYADLADNKKTEKKKQLEVDIADALFNDKVIGILNTISGFVDINSILSGIVGGEIDLVAMLNGIWAKLYKAPVETIVNLLPPLILIVDGLLPILLHNDTDDTNSVDEVIKGLGGTLEEMILNNGIGDLLYGFLGTDVLCLYDYAQMSGNTTIGIGALHLDLNKTLPAILHWLSGDKAGAKAIVGTYPSTVVVKDIFSYDENHMKIVNDQGKIVYTTKTVHYNSNIPVFTNIYIADQFIYSLSNDKLTEMIAGVLSEDVKKALTNNGIKEIITELITFLSDSVDNYIAHNGTNDKNWLSGYKVNDGLNDVKVALPKLIDEVGKHFIDKYAVNNSDWAFAYDGKITTRTVKDIDNNDVTETYNVHFDNFTSLSKDIDKDGTAVKVLTSIVDLLIGNWINALLDFLNDVLSDDSNKITSEIPLVQGLLAALGDFGEQSVITDVFNGLFQLKRSDKASFTLTERTASNVTLVTGESDTKFVGFSLTSGFFLISNILFTKNGKECGLIPFIKAIIENDEKTSANYDLSKAFSAAPLLANSKKAAVSDAGTDYSKLLTEENLAAAQKLVDALDTLLASLLENTSLNGFDLDATDNILSGVATTFAAYFGAKNTNDIIKLVNNYLFYITGETNKTPSKSGKIGTQPTADGDVDVKKVYTSANLSNLVIQTYSLIENLVDYLFYNKDSGVLKNRDPEMLIADALYGLISPDAVAIRMGNEYSDTAEILKKKDYLNWNSFKVQITAINRNKQEYNTHDFLKFGFSAGDKEAFYDALGESLNGIAGLVGALLATSYTDASRSGNLYSEVLMPILQNLADGVGATGVMSADDFNNARGSQQLIRGIIVPLGNILAQLYDKPASFILNLVKGLAGVVKDDTIKKIINGIQGTLNLHIDGICNIINYLSPSYAKSLKKNIGSIDVGMPKENILITILNKYLAAKLGFALPNVNWEKLNEAKSPAEVLLLVYGYVVDTVLGSDMIASLVDSLDPNISDILKRFTAAQVLQILTDAIESVKSPTEVYWSFSEYATKLTNNFVYPAGITAEKAENAVTQLDNIINNIFPLLNNLGVTDIEGLSALVNDNLYTNEIITTIATALYGALNGNDTVVQVFKYLGIDVTTEGVANYLMDKSYGKTYSSAAKTLKAAKSWKKVKKLNWGFKNGSANAKAGFINGLSAALRPLNGVLSVLLAEGKLGIIENLDVTSLVKLIINSLVKTHQTEILSDKGELAATLRYRLKGSTFILTIQSYGVTGSGKRTVKSVLKIDVDAICADLESILKNINLTLGNNGYESAIIPLLEAFMCDGVKTYEEYKKDYAKAKDNLLIDILNPIGNLIDAVLENPIGTVTGILPNLAYFIDSNGLSQAVSNLIAPITSEEGIIGVLKKDGLDVDELVEAITGKKLGKVITDLLGIDADLNLELSNLKTFNIQVIVVPLVNKLLKDKLGMTLPDFTFAQIASHGEIKTVKSAARNDEGKFLTEQVKARKGEVLVAVLRYIANTLITNVDPLKTLLGGIDAIKNNETVLAIVNCILDNIGTSEADDIVRAIFYLLDAEATEKYFDYTKFKDKDYEFSWGKISEDFCRELPATLDNVIEMLLSGGLDGLVSEKLYTDELISKLATGLYGAVEGVEISKDLGSLADLLAQTHIDFTTAGVAAVLTDKNYGQQYKDAAKVIKKAGSWKKVKAENLSWGVTDRDSFMHALVAVLRPLYGVLDVILDDGSLNIFDLVELPGSNAYTSSIVPLFEAFDVFDFKSQADYSKDIKKEYDAILLDIINPVWDKVEEILAAPVEGIVSILPSLGYFIANNGHIQAITNLITPVTALLEALRPIVDVNKLLEALNVDVPKLLSGIGVNIKKFDIYNLNSTLKPIIGGDAIVPLINGIIKDIEIAGTKLGIQLPDINWHKLADCGTVNMVKSAVMNSEGEFKAPKVKANVGKTVKTFLMFLAKTITTNASALKGLLGGIDAIKNNETILNLVNSILDNISKASPEDIVYALQYVIAGVATDKYFDYTGFQDKNFAFNWGEISKNFCENLPAQLDNVIGKFLTGGLGSLVSEKLYTDDLIGKLAKGLYGAIEGVKVGDGSLSDLLAKTHIDMTTDGVAAILTDKRYGKQYKKVAEVIAKAGSWDKVKAEDLKFGVTDRDSFMHALVAVLRPLYGVLDVLFNDASLNLFDIAHIPGSNGYTSAIVPLLEAFDIWTSKSHEQYSKDIDKEYDAILLDIINPLWDKVEQILDKPVEQLISILPSLGYFIANDGHIQVITNLLTPISELLAALKPLVNVNDLLEALNVDVPALLAKIGIKIKTFDIYDLTATLTPVIGAENIVPLINAIVKDIEVSGTKLGIQLPDINWHKLADCGTVAIVNSAVKNSEGEFKAPKVTANIGKTVKTFLIFLAETISSNAKAINNLLNNIDAIKNNKTIANILDSVFGNLENATAEQIVLALQYLFVGQQTDSFFDYSNFKYKDDYKFTWGDLDEDFCRKLAPMLDGLIGGLLEGGLAGLVSEKLYTNELIGKLVKGLYGAIEGVKVGDGSLADILKDFAGIDMTAAGVADLLTNDDYGKTYWDAAETIRSAGSFANLKAENLKFGVKDRDSFMHALTAALRPLFGVLDVLLNDGKLELLDAIKIPGSDGYTSTIVPLLEAFGVYNIKTQYQYREDMTHEYDAILLDIINPLWDKVEDILNAPIEMVADILPNLSLFFANDGLIQIVENLLTPISALLKELRPIVDVNDLIKALGVDVPKLLKEKAGINMTKFDLYDITGTLTPVVGSSNVVPLLNGVLQVIEIKGNKLGIELPEIDWYKLASHGKVNVKAKSQVATKGSRISVKSDQDETLISVLRYIIDTINYKNNYEVITNLLGGLFEGNDTVAGVLDQVFGMLQGDSDTVIKNLVDLLQTLAG